jgi:hypothetical protein
MEKTLAFAGTFPNLSAKDLEGLANASLHGLGVFTNERAVQGVALKLHLWVVNSNGLRSWLEKSGIITPDQNTALALAKPGKGFAGFGHIPKPFNFPRQARQSDYTLKTGNSVDEDLLERNRMLKNKRL